MNTREILDSTIEPPPPFRDIDELIARERRRARARRRTAVLASTAGVVAVVAGGVLIAGPLAPTPDGPAATPTPAAGSVPADETPAQRYARLTELVRTQVAAVLPDATVEFGPSHGFEDSSMTFPGYDDATVAVILTTPEGWATFQIFVVRPLTPPVPRPTVGIGGRLLGGCAGEWPTETPSTAGPDQCEERDGPNGTTIAIADRHVADTAVRVITVGHPNGAAVTVMADPSMTWLSVDDVVAIVADPGFVAGNPTS